MHIIQFLITQAVLFALTYFSLLLTGDSGGFLNSIIRNSIIFIPASLLFTIFWRKKFDASSIWNFVLSVNLCFNFVIYLLYFAFHIPWPEGIVMLQDFAIVAFLSAIGVLIGLRTSKPASQ